jgi:hypothetical protein
VSAKPYLSRDEIRARILAATPGAVESDAFNAFLPIVLEALHESQGVLGDPGTDAGAPLYPLVDPGIDVSAFQRPRPAPRFQTDLLAREIAKLEKIGIVLHVPSDGINAPLYLGRQILLHPFVFAAKSKPPEAGSDWTPGFRVCLDVSKLNPFLVEMARTRLPKTSDMVASFREMILAFNLDLVGAFGQRKLHEDCRHYFGFRIEDPANLGRWKHYVYAAGFFGLASLPGLFQAGLEAALDPVTGVLASLSVLTVFIDNCDGGVAFDPKFRVPPHRIVDATRPPMPPSEAAVPLLSWAESHARFPEAWADAEERFSVLLRTTLRALEKERYTISLAKTRFVSTWSRTMGLIVDQFGHMLDPDRVASWTHTVVRQAEPDLKWLLSFIGSCTYSLEYLNPVSYVNSTNPLLLLATEASRLVRERDPTARSFVATQWRLNPALEECYQALQGEVLH